MRPEELAASHALSRVSFGGHSTLVDLPPGTYRPTRDQTIEVISHGGQPVSQMGLYFSQVSVFGSRFTLASVGGVCTHPDHRGQGLATVLLEHSLRKMRERGIRLVLISGGRGLYLRVGCVRGQIFESVVLRPGDLAPRGGDVTVRLADRRDAALCARLNQMESVHYVRTVGLYQRDIASSSPGAVGDNWIIEVSGHPVGYAFLRTPWGRAPHDRVREMTIQGEWSGSRTALVDALPLLVDRLDLAELWLAIPWQESDLRALLNSRGVRGEQSTMPGHTMRLLDFPGLMDDLEEYIRAGLSGRQRRELGFGQDGDSHTIGCGGELLTMNGGAMTQLVLGIPGGWDASLSASRDDLREIVHGLFPLPSKAPGLNSR